MGGGLAGGGGDGGLNGFSTSSTKRVLLKKLAFLKLKVSKQKPFGGAGTGLIGLIGWFGGDGFKGFEEVCLLVVCWVV